ncbi:MAG: hypothetical protein BGO82_08660 [Devosia sp. 67-54]|uniref:hypothetical protein n=1 Tax=unclassified Devosia TaxID=196773 RepID=UPI000966DA49|nr:MULTISPECIES: hypothetical protein [unclassified Devosia]MBN9307327.1 hypothetical protein [Devosia sp.]OJX19758.1 MAG: hypothetical protein BGO82_08660 [Devosia sp. 67-54]
MDRVISLLAALVGLIALGGAILVHTNADTQRREMATEIAQLKASMSLLGAPGAASGKTHTAAPLLPAAASSVAPPSQPSASMPSASMPSAAASAPPTDDTARAMQDLQARIASLEQVASSQAAELDAARARLAAASAPPTDVATAEPAAVTPLTAATASGAPTATPSAVSTDGPTKDCIPLGTRFMGQSGDSFPLCKTHIVLKVAAVTDGLATISGAGDVAVGATVPYNKGCMLAVFSADDSGFAEMRVTCQ